MRNTEVLKQLFDSSYFKARVRSINLYNQTSVSNLLVLFLTKTRHIAADQMLFFPPSSSAHFTGHILLCIDTVHMWWITEFHVTSKILNLSLLPVFPTFNLKKKWHW